MQTTASWVSPHDANLVRAQAIEDARFDLDEHAKADAETNLRDLFGMRGWECEDHACNCCDWLFDFKRGRSVGPGRACCDHSMLALRDAWALYRNTYAAEFDRICISEARGIQL